MYSRAPLRPTHTVNKTPFPSTPEHFNPPTLTLHLYLPLCTFRTVHIAHLSISHIALC
jgi:hypothetical protein